MMHANLAGYKIIFSKNAEKFLDTIDKPTRQRVFEKVYELRSNSENLDIKKLKLYQALYRLRVGNLRVVYTIKHKLIVIYIVAIGHRKDVYKCLKL